MNFVISLRDQLITYKLGILQVILLD